MAYEDGPAGSLSLDLVLKVLEEKTYMTNVANNSRFCHHIDEKKLSQKLLEFSSWFNGSGRTQLLKLNDKDEETVCFLLLLNLKKSINIAISSIGKSLSKSETSYICSVCGEVIKIEPWTHTWETLQNHEHFEKLYIDLLSGNFKLPENECTETDAVTVDPGCTDVKMETIDLSTHNHVNGMKSNSQTPGINISNPRSKSAISPEKQPTVSPLTMKSLAELATGPRTVLGRAEKLNEDERSVGVNDPNVEPVNTFRFGFPVYYDKVELILYPESLTSSVRKFDGIRDYSVQKSGPCRAVCLLCVCELKHPTHFQKISKKNILPHVHGQRHLKNSVNLVLLRALEAYHAYFKQQEICLQVHSMHFMPEDEKTTKCILCNVRVRYIRVEYHINTEVHTKRVVEQATLIWNGAPRIYAQDLLDIQLNYYKIEISPPPHRLKDKPKNTPLDDSKIGKVVENKKINNQNSESMKKTHSTSNTSPTNNQNSKPKERTQSTSSSSPENIQRHSFVDSISNPNGKSLRDLMPHRYKSHLKTFSKSDHMLRCDKCLVVVGSTTQDLIKHIISAQHLLVNKIKLTKYNFYCEICDIFVANEAAWIDHFTASAQRHASMAESRKQNVKEHECTECKVVIYGDEISLMRHSALKDTKNKSREITMPDQVKNLFKDKKTITEKAEILCKEANQILDEQDPTFICCKVLEQVLYSAFPDCKAYPFGSRISGLGNEDSDLDVFIDTGGMYMGDRNQDTKSQITFVNKSRAIFNKFKDEFGHIVPIPSARTPIVKLWHLRTDLDCDISFRHGLSVENTKFLKYCIKVQPPLQSLILFLKKWSQFCGFYEHITTYAFAMLAIFYMQMRRYLPSVVLIRELNPISSLVIDGWEAFDDTLPPEELQGYIEEIQIDLTDLLKDFFSYYSQFDYKKQVVCPLLGTTIEKDSFTPNGELLPKEMKAYVQKINTDCEPELFRSRSDFCIQDPFDLTHNLTKACPQSIVTKLKKICELTSQHLGSLS